MGIIYETHSPERGPSDIANDYCHEMTTEPFVLPVVNGLAL